MLASLITVWAAGMATPFAPVDEEGDVQLDMPDAAALAGEALALIDRALEVAMDPATTFLAQQQKATTLFQIERFDEAAAILEPLVRRQDAGAPTMLLASGLSQAWTRGRRPRPFADRAAPRDKLCALVARARGGYAG